MVNIEQIRLDNIVIFLISDFLENVFQKSIRFYKAIETRNYQGFKNKKTDKKNGDNPSFLRDKKNTLHLLNIKTKLTKHPKLQSEL